jgi:hypothetical protein
MTTILSPDSSPSVSYNIEGRNVQSYAAAGNFFSGGGAPDPTHATVIASITQHNIVLANANAGYAWGSDVGGFILPSNANIGDLFEIYNVMTPVSGYSSLFIYCPSTDTVDGLAAGSFAQSFATRVVVRLVAANTWRTLSVIS